MASAAPGYETRGPLKADRACGMWAGDYNNMFST
jgi:hypothetical protein